MTNLKELAVLAQAPLEGQNRPPMRVYGNSASLVDVVSRAAADPNTDVAKLEKLLEMFERVSAREAKAAFARALVAVKPKLPTIERNGAITITEKGDRSKVIQSTPYALWEDIDEKITPILGAHGLVLSFRSGVGTDGKITVTGILTHEDGHSEETTMTLPHDSTGSKNAVQAVGSSTSYGKRYTATLLLNIRTRGVDDDGHAGGASATLAEDQIETIFDLINRSGSNPEAFCAFMKVPGIPDIPRADFNKAVEALNTKLRQKK